jgi:hypothetical protein
MDWTLDQKRAAMADAATVCKQAERIEALEAAIEKALRHSDANGMKNWPVFRHLRKTLGR